MAMRVLLGVEEGRSKTKVHFESQSDNESQATRSWSRELLQSRHDSCPHQAPCSHYVVKGGLRPFLMGWLGQAALSSALSFRSLFKAPLTTFWSKCTSSKAVRTIPVPIKITDRTRTVGQLWPLPWLVLGDIPNRQLHAATHIELFQRVARARRRFVGRAIDDFGAERSADHVLFVEDD